MATKQVVLLIECNADRAQLTRHQLERAALKVHWLRDGRDALRVDPRQHALWIINLESPNMYGLDVLRELRLASDVPVILLSAQNDQHAKVRTYQLGGDDFLTTKLAAEEFIARVRARLRRPAAVRQDALDSGGLQVDFSGRRLRIDGREIMLTRVEYELLALLAQRPGSALSRLWLAERALDPTRAGTERTLDVHISRLRKKLGQHACCIVTVWGVGYRFEATTDATDGINAAVHDGRAV